jgi:arginyl-tRNA synthetase
VIQKAAREFSPHVITHYIFDLAKKFSVFYRECSVMNAEDTQLKNARIKLILSVRQVLENAFGIIGMETVEHM